MPAPRVSSVIIMGKKYQLSIPNGKPEDLLRAAEAVDTAMCRIRDAGKVRAISQIAVLAALNIAYDNINAADIAAAQNLRTDDSNTQATMLSDSDASDADDEQAQLHQRLTTLIDRLDNVLVEDGRLL